MLLNAKHNLFLPFLPQYSSDDEEAERYAKFESFLEVVDVNNAAEAAAGGGAIHGITKFADLSFNEFESRYLLSFLGDSLDKLISSSSLKSARLSTSVNDGDDLYDDAFIPRRPGYEYDDGRMVQSWVNLYTTAVKDQGSCGASWAFSATQQIEAAAIAAGISSVYQPMSVQQIASW